MGLCIIMLQHEVRIVDEWHNNRPQNLVTVSLCIQNAINKIQLCSLSIRGFKTVGRDPPVGCRVGQGG